MGVAGQFMLGVLDLQAAGSTSRAVEFPIGLVISTRPVSGRRPRTGRPTTVAENEASDWAGSTRRLSAASRGCPPGGSYMTGIVVTGHLLRWPGQPAAWPRKPGVLPACPAGSYGADLY